MDVVARNPILRRTFPTNGIAGSEYVRFHFQHEIVKEFWLALLEYCHLEKL